jgi:methionine sulfoxide reductase heme-binding subunit
MATWYLARGTGAATLLLLTLTLVLGIVNVRRWAPRGLQRFVVDDLHRTLGLLVVVLLGAHIASSVLDDFVSISPIDALVPFVGSYHPFWLGLGALSLDLLAALIVTSLLRGRIGLRAWRAVHWVAYACWPVAVAHGLGIGTDASGWLLWLTVGCGALVAVAVAARFAEPGRRVEVAR